MEINDKTPLRYIQIKNETIKFLNSTFFHIFELDFQKYKSIIDNQFEITIEKELKIDRKIASRLKRNDKDSLIEDLKKWVKNCNEFLNEVESNDNDFKSNAIEKILVEYIDVAFTLYTHKHRLKTLEKKPTQAYDESNPIMNYEKFIWAFEAYLKNASLNIDRLEVLQKYTDEIIESRIEELAHRAKRELEQLILVKNNSEIKRKVKNEITELRDDLNDIIKDNNLNHVDIMRSYIDFFNVCQEIFDFCDWYSKNIGDLEEGIIRFIKEGKRQMSSWDFLHKTGLYDRFREKGYVFNPTHNCNLLIEERLKNFELKKTDFIESRKIDKLESNDSDISIFYLLWLNNEIKVVDQWLSNKYPNGEKKEFGSNSEIVELIKYKSYIVNEINDTNSIISGKTSVKEVEKKSIDNGKTRILIDGVFSSYLNNGWKYAFNSEDDYNTFANILTNFFQYEDYELPKEVIKLKRNTKTQIGKVLGQIHKDLSEKSLMSDLNYIAIAKVLSPFENDNNVYKALTR